MPLISPVVESRCSPVGKVGLTDHETTAPPRLDGDSGEISTSTV